MKLQSRLALLLAMFSLFLLPMQADARADRLAMPAGVSADDVKPNLPQPYIVKKGDTLWDIAKYFFKDPHKWIKIWEHNLYITNPDLIYPGNKIWFDVRQKQTGGLTTVRPHPQVRVKPVERLEQPIDPALVMTALKRQDFIAPENVGGVGYILDSPDERIHYGQGDNIYLRFSQPVDEGEVFDVFRPGDPVRDPVTGKVAGVLVEHLGRIEVTSRSGDVARGRVIESFAEISRGDRLKPARHINTRIVPDYPDHPVQGHVLYIRDNAIEAGQHQVVGISLGRREGMKAGTVLAVHRAGRLVKDRVTGQTVRLPAEKIGELMVLAPQQDASIALVTLSLRPINLGDMVLNAVRH